MALSDVEAVATAAEAADDTAPLDEDTWLWLRSGWEPGPDDVVTADLFRLHRGEEMHLCVHPDRRGEGRAAAALAGFAGSARAWSHGNHPAAARLADRFGFERVRDLWVMRRSDRAPLPPLSDARIRPFRDGDLPDVLRVNAAAFADHPEQGSLDASGFAQRQAQPWWDPAGLLVAVEGQRLVGFHWTKQHDDATGEVYVVGIDPEAQGRGLGRALTLAGLHHLYGLGVSEVILYVEADNRAAVATYAGLGFTHAPVDTHVQYRRQAYSTSEEASSSRVGSTKR